MNNYEPCLSGFAAGGLGFLRFFATAALVCLAFGCGSDGDSGPTGDGGLADRGGGDIRFAGDTLIELAAGEAGRQPDTAAEAEPEDVQQPPDGLSPPDLVRQDDPPDRPEDLPKPEEVVTPPLPDSDGDGVPDEADLFPNDPAYPGVAMDNAVYMHTADELWTMNIKTYELVLIGQFDWPAQVWTDQMTDIAFDAYGVLYGVSFSSVYTCHPETAFCTYLGELPDSFNALTLVPKGLVDPSKEVIIAISNDGGWYRMDLVGDEAVVTQLGAYGGDYTSSGDAYSILGIGTYAAVNKGFGADDYIIEVDPATGKALNEICPLPGFSSVYGLAGWTDRAFAFDESGAILIIDTGDGQIVKQLKETGEAWWGAGVCTILKEN